MNHREFAVGLAKEAGEIMRSHFALGIAKEWKPEAHDTPVTIADHTINQLVLDHVAKAYPDHAVRAEEGSALKDGAEYLWVCDPLDGTIPFSHGIANFVFSLALVHDGVVELGVVYDPMLDRLFVGEKGKGATLNGEPLKVSDHTDFPHTVMYAPQWDDRNYNLGELSNQMAKRGTKLVNLGSAVYCASMVAAGQLAAAVFLGDEPHDGAAQKVIVEEAGGKVTDANGNEQRYDQNINGQIASNGSKIHEELVALVQSVKVN